MNASQEPLTPHINKGFTRFIGEELAPAQFLLDFYKLNHRPQYPKGTNVVVSNGTPRGTRIPGIDHVIFAGLQGFLARYVEQWDETFFNQGWHGVEEETRRFMKFAAMDPDADLGHLKALHDYGRLPLNIRALPEGTKVPMRVPMYQLWNSQKEFFWMTNYIESVLSNGTFGTINSATIAREFRKIFETAAALCGADPSFCQFQGHDFSFRGMAGLDGATASGFGHLTSFAGTDTIPSIFYAEKYYGANIEKELVGCSVFATEHSVQCAYDDDEAYFENVVFNVHPKGIVSVVSDGRDFWHLITEILPKFKDRILAREGKVVIRPDSGDPVKILCGDPEATEECVKKGLIQCLWDIFGGTYTSKGFKQLDQHIGSIYGDSITLTRAEEICAKLMDKGFSSTNWVAGIGSYTYQYQTRDTFGQAIKATYCEIEGRSKLMQKTPKTDNGLKNSAKGICVVKLNESGELYLEDGHDAKSFIAACESLDDVMDYVMIEGLPIPSNTLSSIRQRILLG